MILIDVCVLHKVLPKKAAASCGFGRIHVAIYKKQKKIVLGGSTYKKELGKCWKYLAMIVELKKAARVKYLDDERVNSEEDLVKSRAGNYLLNDPHLIAISIVGKNRMICTSDKKALSSLKNKAFYPKKFKIPCIYTGSHCNHMLRYLR